MYESSVHHTTTAPPGDAVAVHARGLGKRFGELWALRDLDLDVAAGTVLGLLGHNGAGKTTAIRILTTLAVPTTGTASVAGFDVVRSGADVRRRIGVAAQQATVDGLMSARLNLEMVGRLHHLGPGESRRRADDLLERLDLTEAAGRLVKTFSGGMRRRLDLAASLMSRPQVLFLDEPTTGLDPRSRNDLWDILRGLVRDGSTLILTTQYLEEADRLADDIILLDHGRTVAHGTPDELKARIGGERVEVTVGDAADLDRAVAAVRHLMAAEAHVDPAERLLSAPLTEGSRIIDVVHAIDAAGIDIADLTHRQATLDDVFLTLTGSDA